MVAALCLVALHKSTVQLFKLYALPSFTNIDAVTVSYTHLRAHET